MGNRNSRIDRAETGYDGLDCTAPEVSPSCLIASLGAWHKEQTNGLCTTRYACICMSIANSESDWAVELGSSNCIVLYSKIATHRFMECFSKTDYRRDIALEMILGRMKRA